MLQFIAPIVGLGLQVYSGRKQQKAAEQGADLQNEATEAQYQYDQDAWEMAKQSAIAKRNYAVQEIEEKAKQEGLIAAHKDAANLRTYNYNLQIRDREQDLNDRMYQKSDDIFYNQLGINAQNERSAKMDERRQLREIETENRYQKNDAYIEAIEAEGAIRARGQTGRSIDKQKSVAALKASTALSLLDLSLDNASAASRSALQSIGTQRTVQDLNAYASKMLDPGILPDPIAPLPTPQATFLYPRVFEDYDFGPEPIKGAMVSPSAASAQVWGTTIGSIASTVGGMFQNNTKSITNIYGS
tara:strand:+ start:195 stop:1097 length:903 start_codon:yes stop_codon:yes gene_type:complete